MFRALSIIAAIAALAVSAPVASAGTSKKPPRVGGKMHLEDVSLGVKHASGIIMSDGRVCNPRWGC